jgi:hypothetical protein
MDLDPAVFRREPFPNEIAAAHAGIQEQELAIRTVEQEIQALRAQIARAHITQNRHREVIARCKAVITLARRLPEELLAKIFEFCVADGWTRAPVVVSHVCSSWRRSAMTPRVWSYVYIDGDNPDAVGRTKFWLSRAKEAPLHLSFVITWRSPLSHLSSNLDLLARHASQWVTITLQSDTVLQAWELLRQCAFATPKLREIKAALESAIRPAFSDELEDMFSLEEVFSVERAPHLRSMELACICLPQGITLPSQLTSLTLDFSGCLDQQANSASLLLGVIQSLPLLRRLSISFPFLSSQPFIPETDMHKMAIVPELTSLTFHGPTDLSGFLEHLSAPKLRQLYIRSNEAANLQQFPLAPTLIQFLQGSQANVETLELHDVDLAPEHFLPCFSLLPHLRELRLHDSSISDPMVEMIDQLCPLLTHIDLRWCGLVSGRALVKFVHGRNTNRSPCPLPDTFPMPGSFDVEDQNPSQVNEVAVLNCSLVTEVDVLELAKMTQCRVKINDTDYCRELASLSMT